LVAGRDSRFEQATELDGTLSVRVLNGERLLVNRELDAGPLVD
jgi:hypothetical protein